MDIVGAVASCVQLADVTAKLAKKVYKLIQDVKALDGSLASLFSEFEILEVGLEEISTSLQQDIVRETFRDTPTELRRVVANHFGKLKALLESCQHSLKELELLVVSAKQGRWNRGYLRSTVTTLKLRERKDRIAEIRLETESYKFAVQIHLGMMNFFATAAGNERLITMNASFEDQLKSVGEDVRKLRLVSTARKEEKSRLRGKGKGKMTSSSSFTESVGSNEQMEDYATSADVVLTAVSERGTSVFNGSVVETVPESFVYDRSAKLASHAFRIGESSKVELVASWLQSGRADTEDGAKLALFTTRYKHAKRDLEQRKYSQAEDRLRRCLETGDVLETLSAVEVADIKLLLSIAYLEQKKLDAAKITLQDVIAMDRQTNQQISKASHLLARLYLSEQDYKSAEKAAQDAWDLRYETKAVLTKDFRESTELLIEILERDERISEAEEFHEILAQLKAAEEAEAVLNEGPVTGETVDDISIHSDHSVPPSSAVQEVPKLLSAPSSPKPARAEPVAPEAATMRDTSSDMSLKGHAAGVNSVAFSPNGKLVVSGSSDCSVMVWDRKTGIPKQIFTEHSDWVRAVAISPDSKYIASASDDKTVRVWELDKKNKAKRVLTGHTNIVAAVAWSSDGKTIASGGSDHTVRLWNHNNGECLFTFSEHKDALKAVAFAPGGSKVASGDAGGVYMLWDTATGVKLWRCKVEQPLEFIRSISFSGDGKLLIVATDYDVYVQDSDKEERRALEKMDGNARSAVISPNNRFVAAGSTGKMIWIWDLESGKKRQVLEGHSKEVNSLAFSHDGKTLASASDDSSVMLWDLASIA